MCRTWLFPNSIPLWHHWGGKNCNSHLRDEIPPRCLLLDSEENMSVKSLEFLCLLASPHLPQLFHVNFYYSLLIHFEKHVKLIYIPWSQFPYPSFWSFSLIGLTSVRFITIPSITDMATFATWFTAALTKYFPSASYFYNPGNEKEQRQLINWAVT